MNKLKCKICEFEGMSLITHIKFKHGISGKEYKNRYGDCCLYLHSDELKRKISLTLLRKNNTPEFKKMMSEKQKQGSSCLTLQYWINRGMSKDEAKIEVSNRQKENYKRKLEKNNFRESSHFCKEFWIKRGYTLQEAENRITYIQKKLSSKSKKFLGCKRTESNKSKISTSMKKTIDVIGRGKWASHFGEFNGRSKSEIEFYNYLKNTINTKLEANIAVGEYIVDVKLGNKIIEFFGDFWHANPKMFSKDDVLYSHNGRIKKADDIWDSDSIRINELTLRGYEVLVIWENEWKIDKQNCVDRIKKWL